MSDGQKCDYSCNTPSGCQCGVARPPDVGLIDVMTAAARESDDTAHLCRHLTEHDYTRMARAALDAIRAAGWALVKLPEPQPRWDGELLSWPVIQHWRGRENTHGEVSIRKSDGLIGVMCVNSPNDCPEDARSLAAALLAAAQAAENGGDA